MFDRCLVLISMLLGAAEQADVESSSSFLLAAAVAGKVRRVEGRINSTSLV